MAEGGQGPRPIFVLQEPPSRDWLYCCKDCGSETWVVEHVAPFIGPNTYCPHCGSGNAWRLGYRPAAPLPLTLNDYQTKAHSTAVYPEEHALTYTAIGLANEAGEVLGVLKKIIRGDFDGEQPGINFSKPETLAGTPRDWILKELGDTMWYAAELATALGVSLEDVARRNLEKLAKRADDGTLKGSGNAR